MTDSDALDCAATFDALDAIPTWYVGNKSKFEDSASMQKVLNLSAPAQASFVVFALNIVLEKYEASLARGVHSNLMGLRHHTMVCQAVATLMRSRLPIPAADLNAIVLRLGTLTDADTYSLPFLTPLIGWLEKSAGELDQPAREALARLGQALLTQYAVSAGDRKLAGRCQQLANLGTIALHPGDSWSDLAIADIEAASAESRDAWAQLLTHCTQALDSVPTNKWSQRAVELVGKIGQAEFIARLTSWLPLADKPRTQEHTDGSPYRQMFFHRDPQLLGERNTDILKGLAWSCVQFNDADLARALANLAISTYRKIPQIGARAPKVGNAVVWTLGHMPDQLGLAQLAILKVRVKLATAQRLIEKAFAETAERLGLPRQEIEELIVPTYSLDDVGLRREAMGDFTAELVVASDGSSELRWLKADGKPQKSVPAAIKTEFAEELKEWKGAAKDIQKMFFAQKQRLDTLFLARREWPVPQWRERYLDHPLVGLLARRMIWSFGEETNSQAGIFLDGKIVGVDDAPLEIPDETLVRLWHPIGLPVEEILGWRQWLERHEIQQPFKQAHREVYLLTAAELLTQTYSNRFAAHILKQHQYNALCAARSWKNKLQVIFDEEDHPPSTRTLAEWNLRARFDVAGVGHTMGVDSNESGTYFYLATDQVRFVDSDDAALPLANVPPLVFSEIMRDVDLFVGVTSIANDPNWSDAGPDGRFRNYWQVQSFGELSTSAQTRRDVLSRIVPRLKIAKQCTFSDKFLIVTGSRRTYKIHLGSGNILMEPNEQYLCIVPKLGTADQKNAAKVFLPFEGDTMLSIILSKAFLLADDAKITDPSILLQLAIPS